MKFYVLTISDSCFEGSSEDTSGPVAMAFLKEKLNSAVDADSAIISPYKEVPAVLPDDLDTIRRTVQQICDVPIRVTKRAAVDDGGDAEDLVNENKIALLVTVGGTGFGVRDVTPEAIRPLLEQEAPGLVHAMLSYSMTVTPYAWLSRPVAGVRNGTLVITVPGSKRAVVECLTPLVDFGLRHALELMHGDVSRRHPTVQRDGLSGDVSSQRDTSSHTAAVVTQKNSDSDGLMTAVAAIPSSCSCCTSPPLPPPAIAAGGGEEEAKTFTFDPAREAAERESTNNVAKDASRCDQHVSPYWAGTPSAYAEPKQQQQGGGVEESDGKGVAATLSSSPYPLASRPRNSDYAMVPMVDALRWIEQWAREAAQCSQTVVGPPPAAAASSLLSHSSPSPSRHDTDGSPHRLLTTQLVSDAPMDNLPRVYHPNTCEASIAVEGTVLTAPLISGVNLPPFRASIKDGYAVVSVDGTGLFPVTSAATAGGVFQKSFLLQTGKVCRVSTGGSVPDGADAVVQVEDTELVEASEDGEEELIIRVNRQVAPNTDIRPVGCDIAIGQQVLANGARMGPSEIALWHSVGCPPISHFKKPRVAVISTGNELSAETPLPEGKIYDSNKGMLLSALRQARGGGGGGCLVGAALDGGIVRDDYSATREGIIRAFRQTAAGVAITTGGVSMGEKDHVKAALLAMGATIHFGRVNMKPGKPTTFATIPATSIYPDDIEMAQRMPPRLFFGLPGNPVSAMVCYHVFVVPCLRVLCGHSPRLPTMAVQLTHAVGLDRERPEYHRCRLIRRYVTPSLDQTTTRSTHCNTTETAGGGGGGGALECAGIVSNAATLVITATSTGQQASHRLLSMHTANGLLVLPTGTDANGARIEAGSYVEAIVIDEIPSM